MNALTSTHTHPRIQTCIHTHIYIVYMYMYIHVRTHTCTVPVQKKLKYRGEPGANCERTTYGAIGSVRLVRCGSVPYALSVYARSVYIADLFHTTWPYSWLVGERERPNLSCWVCKKDIQKKRFDPKAIFVGLRRQIGRSTYLYTRIQYNTATLERI